MDLTYEDLIALGMDKEARRRYRADCAAVAAADARMRGTDPHPDRYTPQEQDAEARVRDVAARHARALALVPPSIDVRRLAAELVILAVSRGASPSLALEASLLAALEHGRSLALRAGS